MWHQGDSQAGLAVAHALPRGVEQEEDEQDEELSLKDALRAEKTRRLLDKASRVSPHPHSKSVALCRPRSLGWCPVDIPGPRLICLRVPLPSHNAGCRHWA